MAIIKNKFRYRSLMRTLHAKYQVVIDQRSGHESCLNQSGWPANEITLLEKLQRENPDSPMTMQLERSLFEIPTPQVDNSGLSDSEILERTIPRHVQTLSEYLSWVESLPLSKNERALLDQQAKEQFNDDGDVDDKSSISGNSE